MVMNRLSVPIPSLWLALCIVVSGAMAQHDTVIVSGKDNYWKTGSLITSATTTTVTVNTTQTNQKWIGMGGCFNEKGWEALKNLSATDRDSAINLLFGKNGCHFEWGRIPIGASDYAIERYSLNETANDTLMNNFSIAHDTNYLIPFIKAALVVKPNIQFWASAWTPPTWMKTGGVNGGYDGGVMKNSSTYFKAYALYTIKFIQGYTAKGIPINYVVPQNEPGYLNYYPSCAWGKYNPIDGSTFVNGAEYLSTYTADYLWPALQANTPSTNLFFGTCSNNASDWQYWLATKQKLPSNIKGVCLQWNFIDSVSKVGSNYLAIQSEHQCGNYPWLTEVTNVDNATSSNFFKAYAPNNYSYAQESWGLISKWVKNGVNSYNAWNMVLDTGGMNLDKNRIWPQDALLTVNYQTKKLKVTPVYYVFRHVAQFVDTGAVRLGTTGGDALAFRNPDNSIVVIAYNSGSSAVATSVVVGTKTLKFNIPAIGWATACVGLSTTKVISQNQTHSAVGGLKITSNEDVYRIALPSQESGRIELLTVTGRVLESRIIPQGSREILLPKQTSHAGLLLVRLVYRGEVKTARIFNAY